MTSFPIWYAARVHSQRDGSGGTNFRPYGLSGVRMCQLQGCQASQCRHEAWWWLLGGLVQPGMPTRAPVIWAQARLLAFSTTRTRRYCFARCGGNDCSTSGRTERREHGGGESTQWLYQRRCGPVFGTAQVGTLLVFVTTYLPISTSSAAFSFASCST